MIYDRRDHKPGRENGAVEGHAQDEDFPGPGQGVSASTVNKPPFGDTAPEAINIIRDKTFTTELRRLVERVRENEPDLSGPVHGPAGTGESLELDLYRLYYRAKNLKDNPGVNISINPFDLKEEAALSGMNAAIVAHMAGQMAALSLPAFSLLHFDIDRKAYISGYHTLEGYDTLNIVIGMHDNIFSDLILNQRGIVLDPESIRDDPFLAKRFLPIDGTGPRPLYFTMLSSLSECVAAELSGEDKGAVEQFLPSSIIMAELPDNLLPHDTAGIHSALRRKISLHAFLLDESSSLFTLSKVCSDITPTYGMLDYLFTVFLIRREYVGLSIVSTGGENTGTGYLMKYLISKMNRGLSADSAIIHLLKNRMVIITPVASVGSIQEHIDEYNRLFTGRFTMDEFRPGEFSNSHAIIQRIILGR
ncbi:MAG: hypothetical protein E4G96_02595 [Chrysiogenales bacterium]|nr:MAG: hypothetical protein E4G96_02595 [Chrysiogenales bacterium]